ncbi:SDR family NAD(P)-dependent oxidoreductase [Paenibacillus sp. NPDC057967]|uniref:SDR family NAD(P)-dependent oxidoreductase n=1 Tax=Paenibacillus sp. NPDC057967 TaxID=3346293 RepID=UPI0036DF76D4
MTLPTRHFIITGTTSGIGAQLAKDLLEQGANVYGIARRTPQELASYGTYQHFSFDLSKLTDIEGLVNQICERLEERKAEFICLVNNASMLEPLLPIEQCSSDDLINNIQIGLLAPMMLTSAFIKSTSHIHARRKVVNITSGSGSYPAPGMSSYCSAKAGLNMFTQCVGLEQQNQMNPVEVIAVIPGMVDTEMQVIARSKDEHSFAMASLFRQVHDAGQLITPKALSQHLQRIIENHYSNGQIVTYNEA